MLLYVNKLLQKDYVINITKTRATLLVCCWSYLRFEPFLFHTYTRKPSLSLTLFCGLIVLIMSHFVRFTSFMDSTTTEPKRKIKIRFDTLNNVMCVSTANLHVQNSIRSNETLFFCRCKASSISVVAQQANLTRKHIGWGVC